MSESPDYEFLDCGDGRRLERLGGVVVSRPAPGAVGRPGLSSAVWDRADLSFDRDAGWRGAAPEDWRVALDGVTLGLSPGASGQIGVFPEHAQVATRVLAEMGKAFASGEAVEVLNLFAHTGLATLRFLGCEGVRVTHVDASARALRMARANLVLSGLEGSPVRWMEEDVLDFCRKEVRRGRRYGVILADPPAFGRGGKKREWKLERDIDVLLEVLKTLLGEVGILAITCHRPGWGVRELAGKIGGVGETLRLGGMNAGVAVYVVRP